MEPVSSKKFLQTFLWTSILLSGLAIVQTIQRVNDLEIILWRSKWIFLLGVFALNIAAGTFFLFSSFSDRTVRWMDAFEFDPSNTFRKLLGLALMVFGFAFIWAVRLFFFRRISPAVDSHSVGLSVGQPRADLWSEISERLQMVCALCRCDPLAGICVSSLWACCRHFRLSLFHWVLRSQPSLLRLVVLCKIPVRCAGSLSVPSSLTLFIDVPAIPG